MDTLANSFFAGDMVLALCRTLVHSLWQGLALAVVAGITLLTTRKKSADFRYNLFTLQFVAYLLTVGATFFYEYKGTLQGPALHFPNDPVVMIDLPATDIQAAEETSITTWDIQSALTTIDGFLNKYALIIVAGWCLILCWRMLQMFSGIRYLHHIRRHKNRLAPDFWQQQVKTLSEKLRIAQQIQLLESDIVTVPMVVGFFTPVILIPAGLLAGLAPGQMEAIILHELAHIRRRDFLFNLLQCFAETLFFFNPAVLWVSAIIRDERENCCDDIAVQILENKTHYIRALVAFQEFNLQSSSYAVAFPGRKYTLLDRVKRIIHHQHTKTLSIMEKISLVASLLIVGAIAFLPACQTFAQTPESTGISDFRAISIDGQGTAADPETYYIRDKKGKTYQYKKIENKITEMYVDNQPVPQEKWSDYNWLITQIDDQLAKDKAQAEADQAQAMVDMAEAKADMEQAVLEQAEAVREQEEAVKEMEAQIKASQKDALEAQTIADAEQKEAMKEMREAELERKQAMEEMARDLEQSKRDLEQAKRDMQQAKLDMEQAEKKDVQQAKKDAQQAKKEAEADRKMMNNLMGDIVGDGLAKNKAAINSFRLTDTEMEVNGKVLSAEQHQKYKAKYLKTPGYNIYYGNENYHGTGIFFSKGSL